MQSVTEKERMRELTDHIVSGDQAVQLKIEVTDEPGAGGANHRYAISGFDTSTNQSDDSLGRALSGASRCTVLFQNGPIKEAGVNGITQEALLAIVIDRLKSFQNGPFACDSNAMALKDCQSALAHLQYRTKRRIERGVEGTHQK
jgi:hypothetical protein